MFVTGLVLSCCEYVLPKAIALCMNNFKFYNNAFVLFRS